MNLSDVEFTYIISNPGTTPVSNLMLMDTFDTPAEGLPDTLGAGESVTVTRTESLNEGIDNTVTIMGEYNSTMCADTDVVIIKDKLRERRRHDSDNYRDKGKWCHH